MESIGQFSVQRNWEKLELARMQPYAFDMRHETTIYLREPCPCVSLLHMLLLQTAETELQLHSTLQAYAVMHEGTRHVYILGYKSSGLNLAEAMSSNLSRKCTQPRRRGRHIQLFTFSKLGDKVVFPVLQPLRMPGHIHVVR